jgi:hypothetical protein
VNKRAWVPPSALTWRGAGSATGFSCREDTRLHLVVLAGSRSTNVQFGVVTSEHDKIPRRAIFSGPSSGKGILYPMAALTYE